MPNERVFAVFNRWKSAGRTQTDLARAAGLHPSSLSRAFAGDIRSDVATFAKLLPAMAATDSAMARDLLEAYLLDDIPDGAAPDGRPWTDHVKVYVESFQSPARAQEASAELSELEKALAYVSEVARTSKHGQQFVLSFYRLRHRPKDYFGLPQAGT